MANASYIHYNKPLLLFFLILATLSLLAPAAAQESGAVSFTVTDGRTKRPLNQFAVTLISRDGTSTDLKSGDSNTLRIDRLASGLYEVRISRQGYLRFIDPSFRIVEDKVEPLNVELLPTDSIETVQVLGNRRVVDQSASAGSSFIDQEALRSAVGSGSDVLRALDGLPGLFSSGEFSSFTVRGRGPKDNLILVDDIPFQNVVHFDDSFGEPEDLEGGGRFSVFAPNLIAGAEFQPGGWGPAYAGGAASLLKLNVAQGNPESQNYTLRLDIAGLEVGYSGPSGIDEDTTLLFSARQLNFGRVFDLVGAEDIGTPELTDVIVKTATQLDNGDSLEALLIIAPEEFERDLDNALASDEDDPGNWEDLELANSEADNLLLGLTYRAFIGENAEWTNRFYYRGFSEDTSIGEALPFLVPDDTPDDQIPTRENILSSTRDETEFGWRSDYRAFNRFGQFDAGIRLVREDYELSLSLNDDEWIRYVYDQTDSRPNPDQKFIVLTPQNTNSQFDASATSYAGFVNQTFEFDDWDLRAGLRADRDGITDETLISPRVGSFWQIDQQWQMTTTLGIYYQSPSASELAADAQNASLENERTIQASVGFKYFFDDDISLLIEPYYQQLDNLIVDTDGVEQQFSNSGEGNSWGIDTAINKRFSNGWSAQFNYSYNNARVKDAPELDYYDAEFSRPHFVSLGGIWEMSERWKFSARWKWASGAPRDRFLINENVLPDSGLLRFSKEITETNADRYDGFSSINFRADYRRQLSWAEVIAFADIINLLGSDNPSSAEFNERTGLDVIEDGESIILFGIRLQW